MVAPLEDALTFHSSKLAWAVVLPHPCIFWLVPVVLTIGLGTDFIASPKALCTSLGAPKGWCRDNNPWQALLHLKAMQGEHFLFHSSDLLCLLTASPEVFSEESYLDFTVCYSNPTPLFKVCVGSQGRCEPSKSFLTTIDSHLKMTIVPIYLHATSRPLKCLLLARVFDVAGSPIKHS